MRVNDHEDPEIPRLNLEIGKVLRESRQEKWIEKLEEVDPRHCETSKPHWNLLKNLAGKNNRLWRKTTKVFIDIVLFNNNEDIYTW